MTRYQKPGPKRGGKKKVAPKKAAKSKPIPQQVVEKTAARRDRGVSLTTTANTGFRGDPAALAAMTELQLAEKGAAPGVLVHPTVEEQFDLSDRYRYAADLTCHTATAPFSDDDLPAPKPPGPKSKFWRQYQDESGQFIGFAKALTKTKDQVISRLRLRKPPR